MSIPASRHDPVLRRLRPVRPPTSTRRRVRPRVRRGCALPVALISAGSLWALLFIVYHAAVLAAGHLLGG